MKLPHYCSVFFILWTVASHAILDEIPTNLSQPIEVPLHWENIKGIPLWVRGKAPESNADWGMHQVRLNHEQSVTVQLMPGKWLRLHNPDEAFANNAFEISMSTGTGLYAYLPVHIVEQGHSILILPDPTLPRLVRIKRGKQQKQAQTFALFSSRYKPVISPKTVIPVQTDKQSLLLMPQRIFKDFWFIQAGSKPLEVKLQGPTRITLESRLIYPPTESALAQDYQISAQLDKKSDLIQMLEFETGAETEQQLTIDGKAAVLGSLQVGYLDIPKGEHSLRLTSSANLYIRLLREQSFDYLFPDLNRPDPDNKPELPEWIKRASWQLTEKELSVLVSKRPNTMKEIEKIALRIAQDNSRREGGLLGAMIMREAFRRYPSESKIRKLANSFLGKHSFYRDLLPWKTAPSLARFIPYQLRPPEQPNLPLIVAEQHQETYLKRIPKAYFAPLSIKKGCTAQQLYKLPRRTVPSLLRIVVKEPNRLQKPQILWVQFDNSPPMMMEVIPQHIELHKKFYRFNQGEAGLSMLALDHGTEASTLGGPFASRHSPASLINAGYFILDLPSKVRQIKVWQPSCGTESLQIALQYRAAKAFRLDESEYESITSQFKTDQHFFQYFVKSLRYAELPKSCRSEQRKTQACYLHNHWLPLFRFLGARKKHFRVAISPRNREKLQLLSSQELDNLLQQAQKAQAEKRWLVALEFWSRIAQGTRGKSQREAELARIKTLEQLGELFLAKRLLQELYLDSPDPLLSQQAFRILLSREQNPFAKIPPLATEVLRNPTPAILTQLAHVLVENRYYDYAFMIGMALPSASRPHALMLELSYRFGWWHSFEQLLPRVSKEKQRLWQGYRAQKQGDYAGALDFWRDAGAEGRELANALQKGLQIRQQLQHSSQFKQQKAAIAAWERWQAAHPGPREWKSATTLVKDYARSQFIYGIEQDLFFNVFINQINRPVKLQIPGPMRVRLQFRTLHEPNNNQPLDAWVHVKEISNPSAPKLHIVRLNNILPSDGLRIVGEAQKLGHQTTHEFEFGPGLHEVEVSAVNLPIAIKVQAEKPRLPLAVLPPINGETLVAALKNDKPVPKNSIEKCGCLNCVLLIPRCIAIHSGPRSLKSFGDKPIIQKHLHQWRLKGQIDNTAEAQIAQYIAAKNYTAALAMPFKDILKRMTLLLWIAEQQPAQALVVEAESLFKRYPQIPQLRSLWAALRANTQWKSLQTIESSAGIHFVEMQGWQPESSSMRIRKALLKNVTEAEQIITGYNPMALSMLNLSATTLKLTLRMDDVISFKPIPMSVLYWLDNEPQRRLRLTPMQASQTIEVRVPEGEHILYVAIEKPVANQFLRIRVKESAPLFQKYERSYHVSTPEEPMIVNVQGPNWLRINEWHPTHIDTRFKQVGKGWHRLTFPPAKGQTMALLRLQEMVPKDEKQKEVQLRQLRIVAESLPEQHVYVYEETKPTIKGDFPLRLDMRDGIPLSEQRKDSRSFTASLRRRQNVEEDDIQFQDFFEISTTYRSFDEVSRDYLKSKWLVRFNEEGDITLGARRDLHYKQAEGRPFAMRLSGSIYAQQVWGGNLEWHGLVKGSLSQYWRINLKSYHVPSFSVFGRWLSLNETPDEFADRLDNDVYSDYKADHRFGIALADSFIYEPWRDTRWVGRVRLNSNEKIYKPDYLRLKAEWQQLLGEAQLNLGYRFYHYWSDDDRKLSVNRHWLSLDLSWDIWRENLSRWEWGVKLEQDLDNNELQGMLYLSWHNSHGRGYQDFLPGEVDFLKLRKERLPSLNDRIMMVR
ncbi:MAG: hypothetical protein ABFS56_10725 [Pseudomonadota bacterium]